MKITGVILAAVLGTCASQTQAHQPSFQECIEGSEFILHAAMSRDSGTSRDDFVGRVQSDLNAIQSFPPEYRWFAQDEDDEDFLLGASEAVFDTPRTPQIHQSDFLQACVGRMGTESTQSTPAPVPATPVPLRQDKASRL